jgi:hypothetical protein
MRLTLFAVTLTAMTAPAAVLAGPIESACLQTGRQAATRQMCRCIDRVADRTLTRSEQRRAARFFSDPDMAQQVRMSRSPADNEFWRRYREFGDAAERTCAG